METYFYDLVKKSFLFLVSDYGFYLVSYQNYLVRFESDRVFLTISYDYSRSYELGLHVGSKSSSPESLSRSFTLYELLASQQAPNSQEYFCIQVVSQEHLANQLNKVAKVIQEYASPILLGSQAGFSDLDRIRESEGQQYALDTNLRLMRSAADTAWRAKDYPKLISLLEPWESHLSTSEQRKLKYAIKQASAT